MKRFTLCCLSIIALFILVGCGNPKLDTSNGQAYANSMKKVYDSLSEQEGEEFLIYLPIALEGKAGRLKTKDRKPMTYKKAIDMYMFFTTMGGKKGEELFIALNGLTASDIINKGQGIVKKAIQDELITLEAELSKQEQIIEELNQVKIELAKVVVEINNPIEVVKIDSIRKWKFIIPITIKNNSSSPLYGFQYNKIEFFTENGEKLDQFGAANLNEFVAQDGSMPFKGEGYLGIRYNSKAIAPSQTVNGIITREMLRYSSSKVYPPAQNYQAKILSPDKLIPILKGTYEYAEYPNILKNIEDIKKEIAELKAEL